MIIHSCPKRFGIAAALGLGVLMSGCAAEKPPVQEAARQVVIETDDATVEVTDSGDRDCLLGIINQKPTQGVPACMFGTGRIFIKSDEVEKYIYPAIDGCFTLKVSQNGNIEFLAVSEIEWESMMQIVETYGTDRSVFTVSGNRKQ